MLRIPRVASLTGYGTPPSLLITLPILCHNAAIMDAPSREMVHQKVKRRLEGAKDIRHNK
jgi:hypothetical protein